MEDVFEAFLGAMYIDTGSYELVNQFIIHIIESTIDLTELIMKDNNYKGMIERYFQHNFEIGPTYHHLPKDDISKSFTCKILKNMEIISSGMGITKKKAEQNAAKKALLKYHVISE